jgi:hypothetical protein
MKKLFALFLLTAAAVCAQSDTDTIDLRSRGKLTLFLPDTWKMDVGEFGDRAVVTLQPTNGANASCEITITFPEQDRLSSKAKLKLETEVKAAPIAASSVEGKAVARELNTRAGTGFYCNFTDPELVGRKPEKGKYKVMTAGLIRIAPNVLAEFAIMADDFRSAPYQDVLGALEGMEYAPAGRR